MVTSESDRVQSSPSASVERRAPGFTSPTGTTAEQTPGEERGFISIRDPFYFLSLIVSGATMASLCGLSASVLAIFGLSGVLPTYMLPVTGIVLGTAFLTLGATTSTWARMFRVPRYETSRQKTVFLGGVAAASLAGLAAVVLGILNFAFLGDLRFGGVLVIALGLGLLSHSAAMWRVSHFTYHAVYHETEERRPMGLFAINALSLAPVRDFLVGLGGAILGILAMMNIVPAVLEFVGLLIIGIALSATASTICGASLAAVKGVYSKSRLAGVAAKP